jgi:hypothetical protein
MLPGWAGTADPDCRFTKVLILGYYRLGMHRWRCPAFQRGAGAQRAQPRSLTGAGAGSDFVHHD